MTYGWKEVVVAQGQREGVRMRFRFAQGRVTGRALRDDAHALALHAAH